MMGFDQQAYDLRKYVPGCRVRIVSGPYRGAVGITHDSWTEVLGRREGIVVDVRGSWISGPAYHVEAFANHVICPVCRDEFYPELLDEKTCTHGCHKGAQCVDCGVLKINDEQPYWTCLGSVA